MRLKDLYPYIGYAPRRVSCRYKTRYWSRSDARNAARTYNRQVLFGDVEHYWCQPHGCWHIGHRDKYRYARWKLREDVAWFRMWSSLN